MYYENDDCQITFLLPNGERKTEIVKNTSIISACQRIEQLYSVSINSVKILQAIIL